MAEIDPSVVAGAVGLPPEKAIEYFRAKGYKITWNWEESARAARKQAFTVAKAMKLDILQDLKNMVQKALDEGVTLDQFRKELEPKLRAKGWWGRQVVAGPDGAEVVQLGSPHRLENIYATNMQTAYSAGRRLEQEANSEERPYLMYVAVSDASTRPEHLAMNGKIFHIDDPVWDTWTPSNGYRCRCRTRALTPEQAEKRGGVSAQPKVRPDKGFDNNPAHDRFSADLSKYDPEIRKLAKQ